MYSPKIKEDYIPSLYRMAKFERVPMTVLVNKLIKEKLDEREHTNNLNQGRSI